MAYRIWSGDRRSSKYRMDKRGLVPYIYILVESAALQLIDELVAFIIYAAGLNAQYIILETLTPIVVRQPRHAAHSYLTLAIGNYVQRDCHSHRSTLVGSTREYEVVVAATRLSRRTNAHDWRICPALPRYHDHYPAGCGDRWSQRR